ncbi:unnamed protein product [Nezara viridula]|uniref:Growth hormone-regulated TBC protein 1 n=2 Tax=Nezara viridula TaxID=85310 RepID=A0A9P0HKP4_NEZVI|nr:unnamed protein product [Nezara viridula]
MAQSRFSKIDEYGFERPDDFDYQTYETFMSQYLQILARRSKKWTTLMKSEQALKKKRILKSYIRKGIPNEYREKVWLHVSGANEAKIKHGVDLYKKMVASTHDTTLVEAIRIDLPRTFPDNIFFNSSDEHQEMLFRVLIAYAHHNKKVGYCQGMNYIAGLILLVTKNEDSTFWLLKALVENILPDYYSPTMDGLLTDIDTVSELVRLKYPEVSKHVAELGLPWPVITTKWFICIYCEVLPTETVLRIWDCLFNEGSKIVFRVALTIIGLHISEILSTTQFSEMNDCLKKIVKGPPTVHCHNFTQSIFKVPGKLTTKVINRIRETVSQERKQKKD